MVAEGRLFCECHNKIGIAEVALRATLLSYRQAECVGEVRVQSTVRSGPGATQDGLRLYRNFLNMFFLAVWQSSTHFESESRFGRDARPIICITCTEETNYKKVGKTFAFDFLKEDLYHEIRIFRLSFAFNKEHRL